MVENNLGSQFWHACAGGMIQMPSLNSKVFYFPQGHAEHTFANVDFSGLPRIPPMILCRVVAVKYLADPETDEVYARIRLIPIGNNEPCFGMEENLGFGGGGDDNVGPDSSVGKTATFVKTLTQSDANNGGGFSVPMYCAETIYPKLNFKGVPPFQTIDVTDVHGETWNFRHVYRGTPKRHLLTSGWAAFVNQKKLVAGDLIVFFRSETGDLYTGIRRAKRGRLGAGPSGWNPGTKSFRRFPGLKNGGKIGAESVYEAVNFAANGQPFEVLYYPLAGRPEYFVKASSVSSAMQVQWCSGMRFKMPFETEDASRISWFMGTISSVDFADPILWPNSPWRLLQVTWDEPHLLQNVKRVNPWLVELVSSMPFIHIPTYSPPRKRLRILQPPDFLFKGHFPMMPSFSGNPLCPSSRFCRLSDKNITTVVGGIQGARHAHIGVPLFPDLQFSNKLPLGLLKRRYSKLDRPRLAKFPDIRSAIRVDNSYDEDVSCVLTMGIPQPKETNSVKAPQFFLFGQLILTEQELNKRCSDDSVSQVGKSSSSVTSSKSEERFDLEQPADQETGFLRDNDLHGINFDLDTNNNSQCKVFLESEDVGRTLDLSVLGSYDDLFKKLGDMVGLERSEMECCVFYRDSFDTLKQIGDDAFSVFVKTAKRLTLSTCSDTSINGRKLMTSLQIAGNGLESSNRTGLMRIFA